MQSLIDSIRDILGNADFYKVLPGSYNNSYSWDYGAMIEYLIAGILLCTVVSCVFKLLFKLFGGSR